MISLPQSRVWTGDGYGQNDAVTHTLVKRNDKVALYSVTSKHGTLKGYEVFFIKLRKKGDPLPGGMFEKDDREVYPSANSFGKTAFSCGSLSHAERVFQDLTDEANGVIKEKTILPKKQKKVKTPISITIPVKEFTVKVLSELNKVPYHVAAIFVKEALNKKTIKFTREERLHKIGKPSKFYKGISLK